MAVPVNKEELQQAIETNYNKLENELSTIPVELTTVTDLEGHAKDTTITINKSFFMDHLFYYLKIRTIG